MTIPNWWSFALLGAAAWRTFQLLAFDDILDWPRRRILRMGEWKKFGDPVPSNYRLPWGVFLVCAYCAGFWIALLWWAAWEIWPHATLIVATPFALSAALIALARVLSKDEETESTQ